MDLMEIVIFPGTNSFGPKVQIKIGGWHQEDTLQVRMRVNFGAIDEGR